MAGLLEALGLANLDFVRPAGTPPPNRARAQDDTSIGAKPRTAVPPLPDKKTTPDEQRQELIKIAAAQRGIRAALLAGTEGLAGSRILDKIMGNFKSIGFSYSSNYKAGGLSAGLSGDCRTLSEMFEQLAHEIGFPDAAVKSHERDFMCGGGPIVDPKWGTGNADDGKSWVFQNHHWLVCAGGVYDVLFDRRFTDLGVPRDGPEFDDPATGLTRETYGGIDYYAGIIDGKPQRYVRMNEQQLQIARERHGKVLEQRQREKEEREREKEETKKEDGPAPIEKDDIDMVLGRLKGPVPSGKVTATIERLLHLGQTARGTERPVVFIGQEVAKFCDGKAAMLSTLVFNEEKWAEWMRG